MEFVMIDTDCPITLIQKICTEFFLFLKEWQTLIGALLALAAANWTISTMKSQIRQDAARHIAAKNNKKYAIRAELPEALSDLSLHITKAFEIEVNYTSRHRDLPANTLQTLKNSIEYVDDTAARRIFQLVSWYQVWSARMQSETEAYDLPRPENIYDSALLMHYVNSLFDYARNVSDVAPTTDPTRDEMQVALKNAGGSAGYVTCPGVMDEVEKLIARRHGSA